MGLEDDLTSRGHGDSVTVGQRQSLVVVQYRVEVLNPDGIDRPIQDEPYMLAFLCAERASPQGGEDAVGPVVGGHVQPAEHLGGRDGLGVHAHLAVGLAAVGEGFHQCVDAACLSRARRSQRHHTMTYTLRLVQLCKWNR